MTDAEKKMKRYCNAVEWRLNLPREVKVRVMNDFASSIQARREAGMTEEQIYGELGTPKQAAAVLNEQMKEYAYRKSPWRFVFLLLAALSGGWLILYRLMILFGMLLNTLTVTFSPNESASIGIIGGADGPTSVFVAGVTTTNAGFDWDIAIMVLALIVGIVGFLRLRKCRQK